MPVPSLLYLLSEIQEGRKQDCKLMGAGTLSLVPIVSPVPAQHVFRRHFLEDE